MTSSVLALAIELMVAGLLVATIVHCVRLNRRIERLKADEQALKATIAELITATEIAERAINGLKVTVRECDATLGERLRTAERFVADIDRQVQAGEDVVRRVTRITEAARTPVAAAPVHVPDPYAPSHATPSHAASHPVASTLAASTLAAASAFAARRQVRAA